MVTIPDWLKDLLPFYLFMLLIVLIVFILFLVTEGV